MKLRSAIPGLLGLLTWASTAAAQDVAVDINEGVVSHYQMDPDALDATLTDAIEKGIHIADFSSYLRATANAVTLSTAGMGADYASPPKLFEVGGSVGTAVNSAGIRLGRGDEEIPDFGFAFQAAAMGGVNLGLLAPGSKFMHRFVLYANGMGAKTTQKHVEGTFRNLGARLQYQAIPGINARIVKWGGLLVTGGWEWTVYNLSLVRPLPIQAEQDGMTFTWQATGTYDIDTHGSTIPLEASTSLRVLPVTTWVGLGADVNTTSAYSLIKLGGDIHTSIYGDYVPVGKANVHRQAMNRADTLVGRAFTGLQFNILMVKLYGQVNWGFNGGFGANAGARAVF